MLCSGYTGSTYDSPSYLEIADGYGATTLMKQLTIYCTTNDVALFASLFKNRTKRLGAYGPGIEGTRDRTVIMEKRVGPNVTVINVDEWCVFDPVPRHSHDHFLECPGMLADLARTIAREPANRPPTRRETGTPRWFRLHYRPAAGHSGAALLRAMALFWGGVGNVAVNHLVVALVRLKHWVQAWLKVAKIVVAALAIGGTGLVDWMMRNSAWRSIWRGVVGAVIVASFGYTLVWLRAISIQHREDRSREPAAPLV